MRNICKRELFLHMLRPVAQPSLASHFVAETTSWLIFSFCSLVFGLFVTCFYRQSDFFLVSVSWHNYSPAKSSNQVNYLLIFRKNRFIVPYLFLNRLIWYKNLLGLDSATSKYNWTNNLENVVIFLNSLQMSIVLIFFRWCFQNSKTDLTLPFENHSRGTWQLLGHQFFIKKDTTTIMFKVFHLVAVPTIYILMDIKRTTIQPHMFLKGSVGTRGVTESMLSCCKVYLRLVLLRWGDHQPIYHYCNNNNSKDIAFQGAMHYSEQLTCNNSLILMVTLRSTNYYHPHFTGEDTEAQKV